MLDEDEEFLHDCSIELFSGDGCLSVYDNYPASELSEAMVVFTDDRIENLTNNAAERALRGLALGRRAWLFAGSDRGGERAAVMVTLIMTARLNDIDPQAWLADVFARMPAHPYNRIQGLLPWNWKRHTEGPQDAPAQAA